MKGYSVQEEKWHTHLSDRHMADLKASGLSDETILKRGYITINNPAELLANGYNKAQSALVPCLYMPVYDRHGRVVTSMIKPDNPRINKKGRELKYEMPSRSKVALDIPQVGDNPQRVMDVNVPLWITEGIKKGDALAQCELVAAVSLSGVWGWKAKLDSGGTAEVFEGEDELPFKSRVCVIAFDSDVMRKREVHTAMLRLKASLLRKGARVEYLYLPDMPNGAKQGVDDFLMTGIFVEMEQHVREHLEEPDLENPDVKPETRQIIRELGLQTSTKGYVKENDYNIGILLEGHPTWKGRLAFEQFHNCIMIDGRPMDEHGKKEIKQFLGKEFFFGNNNATMLRAAISDASLGRTYDALQDFFFNLDPWDGETRLHTWMHRVCGTADTPGNAWIGYVLIMQLVARVITPGCIARLVPVLEGPEGTGKTKLIRELGAPWAKSFSLNMESKDAQMFIQGCLVAELAELDTLRKTAESRLKSFITEVEDSYIPKYANSAVSYKRRTVFIGTTNDKNYLPGLTGNTRFLPIETTHIDVETLIEEREQLFAEALHIFDQNPQIEWWVEPDEIKDELAEGRDARRLINEYEGPLHEWLDGDDRQWDSVSSSYVDGLYRKTVTWKEIAEEFLKAKSPMEWRDRSQQMQISDALKARGWTRKSRRHHWVRPDENAD